MTAGKSKIRILDMVIFYGFDPFFGPIGHKIDPRGPHCDLAQKP